MEIKLSNILPHTAELFKQLADLNFMKRYTLVGGTALALQIGHRHSEDLDFIFDEEKLNNETIKRNIAKYFPKYKIIREEKGYQIDFLINNVKLTFFSIGAIQLPFQVLPDAISFRKTHIANIDTIAVLKMATIANRSTIRDYYDLYFLAKYYLGLPKIYEMSKEKLPHLSAITYSETIVYIDDIELDAIDGHLNPKEHIGKKEIATYFTEELQKMFV